MSHDNRNRGMALITILLMMVILVMLTVALITVNSNNLLYTLNYNSRVAALMAAESGVACAIYELQSSDVWNNNNQPFIKDTGKGKFTINFDKSNTSYPYYSTNNLKHETSTTGFRNAPVPPYSVDLIVKGESGSTVRYIRVTLGRANISEGGRCSGAANVDAANFIIQRATSAKDQNQGGSFHSNYKKPGDPNDPSISAMGTTFVQSFGGVISGCGGINIGSTSYDANSGTQIRPKVEPKPIPDINIKALVTSKSGVNPASGGTYRLVQEAKGGQFKLVDGNNDPVTIPYTYIDHAKGQLVFTKDVYFANNVKFEFPMEDKLYASAGVRLEKTSGIYPSLYINGNKVNDSDPGFWVMGKVEGNGSIYNTGSTKFIMETDLVASQETGTELLSEQDIDISLPASRISPISLNMTGAVLTHGNLNATVLDPNAPDNPSVAMTGTKWPNDWVEKCYNSNVYGSGTQQISGALTIDLPGPPPLNPPDSSKWCMKFFPGSTIYDNAKSMGNNTIDLTANGDGSFSFTGSAYVVEVNFYRDGVLVTPSNDDLELLTPNNFKYGSYPSSWYPSNSAVNINNVSYSSTSARNVLYPFICNAINEMFGGSSDPNAAALLNAPVYAPDVRITGALVVTDPNNLDGTGIPNPYAGNIDISLVGPQDKGDFKLIHSRNYEKLLASAEIKTKVVVNSWEELR